MIKKIFWFTTECSSGGIERIYIDAYFKYLETIGFITRKEYHYKFITNKAMSSPVEALNFMNNYLQKNKKLITDFNIIPCVIIDKDKDRKFSDDLKKQYLDNRINLFISNRSFEQWIELHTSNKSITCLKGLSTNEKIAYKKSISQIITHDKIKQAYQNAKQRCRSASDDLNNPYCINYAGSDMFAFIDLVKKELNIEVA